MGLVSRYLEENGFTTVVLTPIPEFNREIGIPRTVAIEYPFGRPVGEVGDTNGQRRVLLETLKVLQHAESPGEEVHLPYEWPEKPRLVKWHPREMSPIVKMYLTEIKKGAGRPRKPV